MSELPELLATLSKFFVFADSIESNTDLEKKHYSTIHSILEQHFAITDEALRRVVWLNHGCPMPALYGDDGEMQCNICYIDFKRMSGSDIEKRLYDNMVKKMHERTSAKPPDEAVKEALGWVERFLDTYGYPLVSEFELKQFQTICQTLEGICKK